MDVIITQNTAFPIKVIGDHAGISTGRGAINSSNDISKLKKRIENCYRLGHTSVFEAVTVGFYISGISRSCSHQLVRHRHMSFCQMSQRYTKVDTQSDDWYVTPPEFKDYIPFHLGMKNAADLYRVMLMRGVRPEDARFVLPEATKTDISVVTNLRELFMFLDLREDSAAQWEIRNLANMMEEKVKAINPEWEWLMDLRK